MPPQPIDISLIVSSRNRAKGLSVCLESIATAAKQAGDLSIELVFVDNGSTDETAEVVRHWALTAPLHTHLLHELRPGLANARNCGLAAAQGRLLAFTDDDCRMEPDYFTVAASLFADDRDPVMRGGRIELGDVRDLPVTIKTEREPAVLTRDLHAGGFIHGCNMVFPRTLADRIGLFDPRFGAGATFRSGEDTDYIHRAFNAGIRVEYVPALVVHHYHGRRKVEDIHRLHAGYAFGNGALYAKYFFDRRSNMRGMLRWDLRQAVREFLGGEPMSADMGLTYRRQLRDNLAGMLAYWRSRHPAAPSPARV